MERKTISWKVYWKTIELCTWQKNAEGKNELVPTGKQKKVFLGARGNHSAFCSDQHYRDGKICTELDWYLEMIPKWFKNFENEFELIEQIPKK